MAPIIHFQCLACDGEIALPTDSPERFSCPYCGVEIQLEITAPLRSGKTVDRCAACGHESFYVQRDFNRNFGLFIVMVGILISVYLFSKGRPFQSIMALAATAAVDFAAYYLVREVTVCYACHAIYRGFPRNPKHEWFDLKELEKYGGRQPRIRP